VAAPKRKPDVIHVETDSGAFDRFQSLEVSNSVDGMAEAAFELGDDGAWKELARLLLPGRAFGVYLNRRRRLVGRAEVLEVPGGATGVKISLVVRTKLADANIASADPKTRVEKTSIRDFILALFAPLGYLERDFVFAPDAARDLMTGKQGSSAAVVDLEPIKAEQAKVNPPESILACAQRHLRRHRMMIWDGPSGEILVGFPDDSQQPYYRFLAKRGPAGIAGNVLDFKRTIDWSEVPSEVRVYGGTVGKDIARSSVMGTSVDLDLLAVAAEAGHFNRLVIIPAEGAKTREHADTQARRERLLRSRRKDCWEITTDAWSYWDGASSIPYAPNTTADVDIDCVGGAHGRYLVTRTSCRFDIDDAPTTRLSLAAVGIWEP
jgi:prophage tail gpP-like protein